MPRAYRSGIWRGLVLHTLSILPRSRQGPGRFNRGQRRTHVNEIGVRLWPASRHLRVHECIQLEWFPLVMAEVTVPAPSCQIPGSRMRPGVHRTATHAGSSRPHAHDLRTLLEEWQAKREKLTKAGHIVP